MPRSKRNKLVSLTATTKRSGREHNEQLFDTIRSAIEEYPTILVFSVDNMRNTYLKTVRQELSDSRLFFGKTKVMAKALGLTEAEEQRPGLSKLAAKLQGNVGLIFSMRGAKELIEYFDNFVREDFARMGTVAPRDFVIPGGVVYSLGGVLPEGEDVPLAASMETTVRGLGMPTRLVKGKVVLEQEFVVCREGEKLDSKKAALLKLFGRMAAEFVVRPVAYWDSASEDVTVIPTEDNDLMES